MARGLQVWSQTAASNNTADSGVNWAEGMAPSAVNDSARAEMASMAKWRDDNNGSLSGTLSTATYSVTSNQVAGTLTAGYTIVFQLGSDMPATALLNLDVLGAKPLRPVAGTDFVGGEYKTSQVIRATYFTSNSGEWIVTGAAYAANVTIHNQTAESAANVADELLIYSSTDSANRKVTVTNLLKNINGLTADASPDGAADYVATYDASASLPKKVLLSSLPSSLPRGYIDGCILTNGGDAVNDITISAGVCRDSTNTVDITVPAFATGKQLDANWAAGDAAGMRNSASGITNTTYHLWAVRTAASATADIYAHTSTTAATVLTALQAETGGSSYAYLRLIGSIVRAGGSPTILAFKQKSRGLFLWVLPVVETVGTAFDTTQRNYALTIPTGIDGLMVDCTVSAYQSGGGPALVTGHPDQTLTTPTTATPQTVPLDTISNNTSLNLASRAWRVVNSSAQIAVKASGAVTAGQIFTFAFVHPRGTDA